MGNKVPFSRKDNLERTISLSEITYINMLALLETVEGYTEADYMFYMKEEGKGAAGMHVIDSEESVEEMPDHYAEQKVLNITVIKANEPNP